MNERVRVGVLLAIAVLVYANTLGNGFVLDDHGYILRNPTVTNFTVHGLFEPNRANNVLRPVTFATLAANWAVAGERPFSYHLFNVLLNAAVVLLLYLVLKKLLENLQGGGTVAWAAALLFAVHPIHTEAVASIVGRSELLAAGFLLGGWLLHLEDQEVGAIVCLILALMAKESAVVFLPLVVAGDYVRGKFRPLSRYAGQAVATVLYVGVLWKLKGGRLGELHIDFLDNPLAGLPFTWRTLNAVRIGWKYVGLQLYPGTLSSDYSYNAIALYASLKHTAIPAIAALLVIGVWIWSGWSGRKAWFLAGAIYLLSFAPTANIVTATGTIMAERLTYLPSAGFCLMIALVWFELAKHRQPLAGGILAVVLLVLSGRTIVRNRDWHDDMALFFKDVQAVPRSAKIHGNVGVQYKTMGQLEAARKEFQTALRIYPDFPEVLEVYGIVESQLGADEEALRLLGKAYSTTPRESVDFNFRAVSLAAQLTKLGQNEQAEHVLDEVIAQSPGYGRAWSNRAVVRYKRGEKDGAHADAEMALRLDPANAQAQTVLNALSAADGDGSAKPNP